MRIVTHQPTDDQLRPRDGQLQRFGQSRRIRETAAMQADIDLEIHARFKAPRPRDVGDGDQAGGRIHQPLRRAVRAHRVEMLRRLSRGQGLAHQKIRPRTTPVHLGQHRFVEDHEPVRSKASRHRLDQAHGGERLDHHPHPQRLARQPLLHRRDIVGQHRAVDDHGRLVEPRALQRRRQRGEVGIVAANLPDAALTRREQPRCADAQGRQADEGGAAAQTHLGPSHRSAPSSDRGSGTCPRDPAPRARPWRRRISDRGRGNPPPSGCSACPSAGARRGGGRSARSA